MKRIFLTLLLFIFLVPLWGFAETPNVNFSPSETQLQGQPAVICEAPYFRITLPAGWKYDSQINNNQLSIQAFSDKEKFSIQINAQNAVEEEKNATEKFVDDFKKDTTVTNKEIRELTFANNKFTRLSSVFSHQGDSCYCILYFSQNRKFVLISFTEPENYAAKLPLLDEIISTLEFK